MQSDLIAEVVKDDEPLSIIIGVFEILGIGKSSI